MQRLELEKILPHFWISGRSSRAEWWRVHITCAVLAVMLEHAMTAQLAPGDGIMPSISLLWPLARLALAWVVIASTARRFHDRGKSGWWALLDFVPLIGWLWILIECGFLPGKRATVPAFKAAPAPMPAPAPATPAPRTAARARMGATPRVGTVQRREYRPFDAKRALKLAGNAIGLLAVAFIAYKIFLDSNAQIFTDLTSTFAR